MWVSRCLRAVMSRATPISSSGPSGPCGLKRRPWMEIHRSAPSPLRLMRNSICAVSGPAGAARALYVLGYPSRVVWMQ